MQTMTSYVVSVTHDNSLTSYVAIASYSYVATCKLINSFCVVYVLQEVECAEVNCVNGNATILPGSCCPVCGKSLFS